MIGKVWWSASSAAEAAQWRNDLYAKGALWVEFKPDAERSVVDVLFWCHKEQAEVVLGYIPDEEEWLDVTESIELAETLGFSSLEDMVTHQAWLDHHGSSHYLAWVTSVLEAASVTANLVKAAEATE